MPGPPGEPEPEPELGRVRDVEAVIVWARKETKKLQWTGCQEGVPGRGEEGKGRGEVQKEVAWKLGSQELGEEGAEPPTEQQVQSTEPSPLRGKGKCAKS